MRLFALFCFYKFCKSDMSRYGYLEIFQRHPWTEITRVDCIVDWPHHCLQNYMCTQRTQISLCIRRISTLGLNTLWILWATCTYRVSCERLRSDCTVAQANSSLRWGTCNLISDAPRLKLIYWMGCWPQTMPFYSTRIK